MGGRTDIDYILFERERAERKRDASIGFSRFWVSLPDVSIKHPSVFISLP